MARKLAASLSQRVATLRKCFSFVGEHNGARADMVEQSVGDLPVVGPPSCQAESDRETLRIDDG
jgi:hypothetical protein